jgi:hypothetical protein
MKSDEEQFSNAYLADYLMLGNKALADLDGPISSAELIELDYGTNFKVLTEKFAREQYVLTQCGTTPPTDADINKVRLLPSGYTRKFFTIPLQHVRAESTVQLSFLEILGLQDRVAQVSKYAVSPCWQKSISCGGLAVDAYSNASMESEQRNSVDAFFADCPWDYATSAPDCAALSEMPNAIHFSTSQDPAPLHSAEHIKFMAAFFNKEADAFRIFQSKVTNMKALRDQLDATSDGDKPVVAWIEKTWDGKIRLSTPPYQKLLTEYAGGTFVDGEAVKEAMGDKMDAAYTTTDVAAFFEAMQGVDALIDLTYASDVPTYDFNKFLTDFGLDISSDLPFIKNSMVIRVDAQISGVSNLDWFESRLLHPDLTVKGLQRVLNPGNSEIKKFFRNIAIGETSEVFVADECKEMLVTCASSDYPAMLPMINDLDCDQLPGNVKCPGSAMKESSKRKNKRNKKQRKSRKGKTQRKSRKSRKSKKNRKSKKEKKGKN